MIAERSKVYFTNLRTKAMVNNLPMKLQKLIREAGIDKIDFKRKFVAIKIHFGEPGNLSYLRPNYAKAVADVIKDLGGKPFLTDSNTLYVGRRKDALDHLEAAYENGFSPFSTGCHILIGDGLTGTNAVDVPIKGELLSSAKIGTAIMDADIIVSLTHFKGHEMTGFGGTLKNLGMGSGSRAGKMEMHNGGKPYVVTEKCIGCGKCYQICAHAAPVIQNRKAHIDHIRCVGCGRCLAVCPADAIEPSDPSSNLLLNKKIAEYSLAVVQNRPNFHISLVIDVSPNCDCHSENDLAIVPDIGFFASFDPVALDVACADAVNRMPIMPGSWLDESEKVCGDHFVNAHHDTDWRSCVEHAEKIGVGRQAYDLIEVE